jgi:hypothetical protein
MVELTRDYGILQDSYNTLLAKKQESKIASNLETQQIGERLSLLDPARPPAAPFRPNRRLYTTYGFGGGLVFGALLILLLEYRDSSFTTDDEVTSLLSLPVLAVVPLMQSDEDRRRTGMLRMALHVGLGSTVAGCLAVILYAFVR